MVDVVWFKRDLRIHDHVPLVEASASGEVIPLYIIEPALWKLPDTSERHWLFLRDCLIDLRRQLAERGAPLVIRVGEAEEVLAGLHRDYGIDRLWSHEETGNAWTYERDKNVAAWTRRMGVTWIEVPQNGVIRRLKTRDGWAEKWQCFMKRSVSSPPAGLKPVAGIDPGRMPAATDVVVDPDGLVVSQVAGRQEALNTLDGFLKSRGRNYHRQMSSPVTSPESCSRLSTHLAMGTLSIREVVQKAWARQAMIADLPQEERGPWNRALNTFLGRLHWHCHFMQKLETTPCLEFQNMHRGYDGLREGEFDAGLFQAWATGQTGYPFIDASMRCLAATGWLGFRQRALLVSFAAYHLWLHWREPGLYFARMMGDYEPGIHWCQMQMQSATTGINAARIYNPVKQSYDQDPDGLFIRRWLPELEHVPLAYLHEPWRMDSLQQAASGCILDSSYPSPVVDYLSAARKARERIYGIRQSDLFQQEARAIILRHGSRKRPNLRRGAKQAPSGQVPLQL